MEERNVASRLRRLGRAGYALRETEPRAAADLLRRFHQRFAAECASGSLTDEGVAAILDAEPAFRPSRAHNLRSTTTEF